MKNVYCLESRTGSFSMTSELDIIKFGNQHDLCQQFFIHATQFYKFYESIKTLMTSLQNHLIQRFEIFENEQNGTFYFWEIVKVFDNNKQAEEFVTKIFIKDISNNIIYIIHLSESHLFNFLRAFSRNIISCLSLNNLSKLWLKHCSTFPVTELKCNYFEIYKKGAIFLKEFSEEDDIYSLVELFEHFYFIILCYKNLLLLVE